MHLLRNGQFWRAENLQLFKIFFYTSATAKKRQTKYPLTKLKPSHTEKKHQNTKTKPETQHNLPPSPKNIYLKKKIFLNLMYS